MAQKTGSNMIRVYGALPFDRGAKARWLLTEMKVPFESHWLDLENGEMESPRYLEINPMGLVPAMKFGDQTLVESGAMCAYLADRFMDKKFAPALASPERPFYEQWMYFAHNTLDLIQTRMMIVEDIPAGKIRDDKEAALYETLEKAMGFLERQLKKSEFLLGSSISAADICVGYHLYWLTLWPELKAKMQKAPKTLSYLAQLQKRPAAAEAKVFSYEE